MYGLAKQAGLAGKAKNFVHDFTGKNEEKAHQYLLQTMKDEKAGTVHPKEISKAIKENSLATENKYKARTQGAMGLAGAAAIGTGAGLATTAHKKKQTRLEREEGL